MAKPNFNAPLGQGGRFAALKNKLAKKPGIMNPAAVAASIGRKKYGKAKFSMLGVLGKRSTKGSPSFTQKELMQGHRKC